MIFNNESKIPVLLSEGNSTMTVDSNPVYEMFIGGTFRGIGDIEYMKACYVGQVVPNLQRIKEMPKNSYLKLSGDDRGAEIRRGRT